jgi:ATP-binding protein involved in chromosome partitioning
VVNGVVHGAAANTRVEIEGVSGPVEARTDATGRFSTTIDLFGAGGADRIRKRYDLPLLGRIPLDPRVRVAGDSGKPVTVADPDSAVAKSFMQAAAMVAALIGRIHHEEEQAARPMEV